MQSTQFLTNTFYALLFLQSVEAAWIPEHAIEASAPKEPSIPGRQISEPVSKTASSAITGNEERSSRLPKVRSTILYKVDEVLKINDRRINSREAPRDPRAFKDNFFEVKSRPFSRTPRVQSTILYSVDEVLEANERRIKSGIASRGSRGLGGNAPRIYEVTRPKV